MSEVKHKIWVGFPTDEDFLGAPTNLFGILDQLGNRILDQNDNYILNQKYNG